ncbi:serine hydrolase domain-containing protein [Diaminobutyricibacter sp. McL0618]|uniref:serine hydrolase domain-containing protein n=1 Tax=Leifsonia sp. McL0618 TaxID=3415677 RepID=UPI003CF564D5
MKSLDEIQAFIDTEFAGLVRDHKVPGAAIAVLKDGQIIDGAGGVLSTSTLVDATPDSVFQIGSITKVWTATLVLQLVDDGLLDLDLPIQTYVTDFHLADEASAASITTRQLLSHQGGFEGDVFTDTGRGEDAIAKYVTSIAELPQLFSPGELFSYNNVGFSILGRLVEVLREKTWEQALVDHIVTPLGLTHVAPSAYEAILHRAAVGHVGPGEDGVEIAAPVWALARSNEPAGSMLAMRPRDLVSFVKMHLDGGTAPDGTRILSADSVAAMQTKHVDLPRLTGMGDAWGLGWEIIDSSAPTVLGHDGGTIGQAAFLRIVPEAGLAVAMLTNGGDVFGLFESAVARILAEVAGVTLPGHPLPPEEHAAVDATPYLGLYSDTIYDIVVSQDEDGRVWIDRTPKDIIAEIGGKPDRSELVAFGKDSLIQLEGQRGIHPIYAFLGDAGDGKAKYIHYGRVVTRAS